MVHERFEQEILDRLQEEREIQWFLHQRTNSGRNCQRVLIWPRGIAITGNRG
jgi:hypothetical protein